MLNDFFEVTAHGLVGFGLAIFGIDADGERNIVSRERALRDFAGQAMDVFRGEAVRDLNMNRTHVGAGAVIVENEVIGTTNLGKAADEGVEFAGEPGVAATADDVEDGIAEDFEAGFDNEQGDNDAEDAVETDPEKHGRENTDQGREREDGVKHCVEAGGEEASRILGAADGFDVEAEKDFDKDGGGDNDNTSEGVVGKLGVKDFRNGFDESEGADRENDRTDNKGGEIFVATVAVGVFAIRTTSGEFRADNSDDRGENVSQVVHGVEDDCVGGGDKADRHFEGDEDKIGDDADNASPNNNSLAVRLIFAHHDIIA